MKKIIFLIFGLIIIQSCEFNPSEVAGPLDTTTVEVTQNFSLCSKFFEGPKSFNVYISVDVLENGNVSTNYWNKQYSKNNDADNSNNFTFDDVKIPETGSYKISVRYTTTDCYVCGFDKICDATNVNGQVWSGGNPMFFGETSLFDQTERPLNIYINLIQIF